VKASIATVVLLVCIAGRAQAQAQATAHAPDGAVQQRLESILIHP